MTTANKAVAQPSEGLSPAKNPKRVAVGRLNGQKRKGLTPEGRERLRQAALRNQPWRQSTGPRSAEGKAKVALNGKKRSKGGPSVRDLRALMADLVTLATDMRESQHLVRERLGVQSD